MGDIYRSVYKKNRRGYGGLSISMADRDFQEDEVWDAYDGHKRSPPKVETFVAGQHQNSNTHQRTSQSSSLSRMFGRDKSKSYPVKAARHSVPVSIPDWSKICTHGSSPTDRRKALDEENEDDDEGEVYELPPHEWLDRKHSRRQSFSVVEGAGRTLKGRDLSKVRDSVLTRTGFLE